MLKLSAGNKKTTLLSTGSKNSTITSEIGTLQKNYFFIIQFTVFSLYSDSFATKHVWAILPGLSIH